jgi:hypothetical protein
VTFDALLIFLFVSIPFAVLLVGPDDAILHRLMQHQRLRTWHYETLVVMAAVAVVVIVSGGSPVEWCGWAALVLAHGRNSILARLAEAQEREDHRVECARWARRYLLLAEACWAVYFVAHRSWAALCGVAVFAGYAQWRAWRRS